MTQSRKTGSAKEDVFRVLLLEDDELSAEARQQAISLSAGEGTPYKYRVSVAHNEREAADLIDQRAYDFLLVDFRLGDSSSSSDFITAAEVDESANGSKVAKRLLERHRKVHRERPWHPRQLRPIVYSAAVGGPEADRIRIMVLCDGAYEFISEQPEQMSGVLQTLTEMCELQQEMQRMVRGQGWISRIMQNLGCGISIIGRNWKIWYCSDKNAKSSGIDPKQFHDRVCWKEYHGFEGRCTSCPECPAAIVMFNERCRNAASRGGQCIIDRYPFESCERSCGRALCIGEKCPRPGKRLSTYRNCRLLPLANRELRWVYVIASPIMSRDGKTVLAAIETVVDIHDQYEGYYREEQLAGRLSAEDRLRPVLGIVQWLGYNRARIFRVSAERKHIIGLIEIGGQLRITFEGYRYPANRTILRNALPSQADLKHDQRIQKGPWHQQFEFGKEHCRQHVEFILRDPETEQIIGMMVIDDVRDKDKETPRRYSQKDIDRLRPIANYVAHVLHVRDRCEHDQALDRHAKSLRHFEEKVDEFPRLPRGHVRKKGEETLRRLAQQQLRQLLRSEPEVLGFHLRFLEPDGALRLYRGFGAYSREGKDKTIDKNDPHSLSAECLRENSELSKDRKYRFFQEFVKDINDRCGKSPGDGRLFAARDWCEKVDALICFPIYAGKIPLGVLAIQSSAADFFHKEDSIQFLKDACNAVARLLGPARQEAEYDQLLENIAYTFRSPAAKMLDCATVARHEAESDLQKRVADGLYALAHHVHSRARTFILETRARGNDVSTEWRMHKLAVLWDRWIGIFGGLANYGRKEITLRIDLAKEDQETMQRTTARTDETLLTEIVFNIYENAVKACNRRVRVEARLDRAKQQFIMTVDDDGRGISKEAMSHLWEGHHHDFERGDTKGFGLGLKWSKRHAIGIGATLLAEPKGPLGGAHFEIAIPVKSK